MKKSTWLLLTALFLSVFSVAMAQTIVPPTGNVAADNLLTWITPILVPLLIAGVKQVLPKIPRSVLPVLGPILGAAIDIINHYATGAATNTWAALALGAAGVGVREIYDQVKRAATNTSAEPLR